MATGDGLQAAEHRVLGAGYWVLGWDLLNSVSLCVPDIYRDSENLCKFIADSEVKRMENESLNRVVLKSR